MTKKGLLIRIVPLIMFLVLFSFTLFVGNLFYRSLRWRVDQDLNEQSAEILKIISSRVGSYGDILYSTRSLFIASESVERQEFKNFVLGMNLGARQPGLSSVVFVQRISRGDKQSFIEEFRKDTSVHAAGYPDFNINPDIDKGEYYVGKYVEPEEGRSQVLGFDFSSEVARNRAFSLARDQNVPIATDVVNLVTTQRYGVNIILPIYKNGAAIGTLEQRRENLFGFVLATIRADDFFSNVASVAELEEKNIVFEVSDLDGAGREILLFSNKSSEQVKNDLNVFATKIPVANREWNLRVYGKNSLDINSRIFLFMVVGGGIIISFLFSALLFVFVDRRNKAVNIAEEMTRNLKESEEKFKAITESAKDAIVMMDSAGKIILWNQSAERLFGYTSLEVIGKDLHKVIPFEKEHQNKRDNLNKFFRTGLSPVLGNTLELPVKNKKGERIEVELTVSRAQLNGGWNAIGIMRDITERKKQQEDLQARTEELEKMNKNMVGRELKMVELKEELEQFKRK